MIYTLQSGQSFDAEILRQELVKAIGAEGWYLNTYMQSVEFVGEGFDPTQVILSHFDNGPAREAAKLVPQVVTMRQARLALLQSGLLTPVNTAVAAADDATKITWEFSSEVRRDHPFVATLAMALNLSPAQLDNLFKLAATL